LKDLPGHRLAIEGMVVSDQNPHSHYLFMLQCDKGEGSQIGAFMALVCYTYG
jgi:hypothetical protein